MAVLPKLVQLIRLVYWPKLVKLFFSFCSYQPVRKLVQVLEEQMSAPHEARPDTASGSKQAASESSAASQLASKAHEVYRLQEELLQQRQKLAFQDIQVHELHAALQAAKNKARQMQDEGLRQVLCSVMQLSLSSSLQLCICFMRTVSSWCLAMSVIC